MSGRESREQFCQPVECYLRCEIYADSNDSIRWIYDLPDGRHVKSDNVDMCGPFVAQVIIWNNYIREWMFIAVVWLDFDWQYLNAMVSIVFVG